jgi:hypothetical protein
LNEPSITLDKKQVNNLKSLWENQGGAKLLYWRVLVQDSSGNEQISQARHIYVSSFICLILKTPSAPDLHKGLKGFFISVQHRNIGVCH